MGDPHTKANLLLQAHFSDLPLPVTDYKTDTKSVLDQAIRVIQGMIDIASSVALDTTLMLINLLQMVICGQWINDCPFQVVNFLSRQDIWNLSKASIKYWPQLMQNKEGLSKFLASKRIKLEAFKVQKLINTLPRLPQINLGFKIMGVDDSCKPVPSSK